VRAAAAAKPAMLISVRVLIHVHPDDLSEYFGNVITIIGSSGQAIINGKWSSRDTIQSSNRSWAHELSTLERAVKAEGGMMQVVTQEECEFEGIGEKAISGTFRIVRDPALLERRAG
jgi:hypothetical protein